MKGSYSVLFPCALVLYFILLTLFLILEFSYSQSVNITEFLKPAEGERYYSGGRGRGRGRGSRGGYSGNAYSNVPAPSIEDPGQFPTLSGK